MGFILVILKYYYLVYLNIFSIIEFWLEIVCLIILFIVSCLLKIWKVFFKLNEIIFLEFVFYVLMKSKLYRSFIFKICFRFIYYFVFLELLILGN